MMRRILFLHEVQKRSSSNIILRTDKSSQFRIGRSLENTLVIEDINVSKYHCIFVSDNNSWYIEDQSTNGTWLNGCKLDKDNQYLLQNEDIIALSKDIKFKYEVVSKDRVIVQPCNDGTQPTSEVDYAKKEFQCSICAEMFIKAVTLSCSHTFCKYCIAKWHENNTHCPHCAAPIVLETATLVLDNYINAVVKNSNKELQEHRISLDKQREAVEAPVAPEPEPTPVENMEVTSDTPDATEVMEFEIGHNNIVDYNAAHRYYSRKYGRCYLCDQRGYGTTVCTFKRP